MLGVLCFCIDFAWDERASRTRLLRVKGGASDYRFFPEASERARAAEPG